MPLARSQRRSVRSPDQESACASSANSNAPEIVDVCPSRVCRSAPGGSRCFPPLATSTPGRDPVVGPVQEFSSAVAVVQAQSAEQLSLQLARVSVQNVRRHAKRPSEPFDLGIAGAEFRVGDQGVDIARGQLPPQPVQIEQKRAQLVPTTGAPEVVGQPVEEVAIIGDLRPGHSLVGSVAPEQRFVSSGYLGAALADEVSLQVMEADRAVAMAPGQRAVDEQLDTIPKLETGDLPQLFQRRLGDRDVLGEDGELEIGRPVLGRQEVDACLDRCQRMRVGVVELGDSSSCSAAASAATTSRQSVVLGRVASVAPATARASGSRPIL